MALFLSLTHATATLLGGGEGLGETSGLRGCGDSEPRGWPPGYSCSNKPPFCDFAAKESYTDLLFRIKLVFSFTVYSISYSAATKEIYVCFLLMLSWFNFYIEIFDLPAIHFDVKEKGMDSQLIVFLNG